MTVNVSVVVLSAVNQLDTVAPLVTVNVQIFAESEDKFVMSQLAAFNTQPTDKSASAVTFQLKVDVSSTINVPASSEVAVAVPNELVVVVKSHIVAVVDVNVAMLPVSAFTVVPVKVQVEVTLPVKVTSQLTV